MQMCYHIATLMHGDTNKGTTISANQIRSLIGNDHVVIVFDDTEDVFHLSTISSQCTHVALLVRPHDNTHLHVQVMAKDEVTFARRCTIVLT